MTVANPSFEIAGIGAGDAQSWVHSGASALYVPTSIRSGVGVGASSTSTERETFALTTGQTLTLIVNGLIEQTVTFVTADFVAIATATAAEVAAVINREVFGVIASVSVDEEVVITTVVTGPNALLQITGGTATNLGFTITTTRGSHTSTTGVDDMESYWRSPLGFNIIDGETADPYIWAQAYGDTVAGSDPVTTDLVVNPYVTPDTIGGTTDGVAVNTDAQSARATITSSNHGPYSGLNTLTFIIEIDGGAAITTTFGSGDDTTAEVVAAIQTAIDGAGAGVPRADATVDVHGTSVVITSRSTGADVSSVKVTTGTANSILGFTDNTTVYGRDYITATLRYSPFTDEDDALIEESVINTSNPAVTTLSPDDRQDGTVQIPLGATAELSYPITMANSDIGFGHAAHLASDSEDADAIALSVHGIWTKFPMNEVDLFAFTSSDLTQTTEGAENFEYAWGNDGGFANDFSLVPSESVPFGIIISRRNVDNFNLENGQTLILGYDDGGTQTVVFDESDALIDNIDAVTPQEAINVINRDASGAVAEIVEGYSLDTVDRVGLTSRVPFSNIRVTGGTANSAIGFEFSTDDIGTSTSLFEGFERAWWNAPPTTPPTHLNDEDTWGFEDYIENTIDAYEDNDDLNVDDTTFVITEGINDLISIYFSDQGTIENIVIQLTAGTYDNATAMAAHLASKIDTALNADDGTANSAHFSTSVSSRYLASGLKVSRIHLITAFDVEGIYRPYMELKDPPSHSAWPTLGFITGRKSQRTIVANNISSAEFDAALDNYEDFEEEWDNPPGATVFDAATFGTDDAESFETTGDDVWTLTLTV